jgi:hypothetical protein
MQGDQIGPKIVALAQLTINVKITKKYIFISKQPNLPVGAKPTLNVSCFTCKENCLFLLVHSPSSY